MGGTASQGEGRETLSQEAAEELAGGRTPLLQALRLAAAGTRRYSCDALVDWHVLDLLDGEQLPVRRQRLQDSISKCSLEDPEDRAIGCLLGLAVGDAMGAPLEFVPVDYSARSNFIVMPAVSAGVAAQAGKSKTKGKSKTRSAAGLCKKATDAVRPAGIVTGFDDSSLWDDRSDERIVNRFMLVAGQWTDDTSMALCLADSLLLHLQLDPLDLRLRFLLWWRYGYCNAFCDDSLRVEYYGGRQSIGLGQTIGETLSEFERDPQECTSMGRTDSSGNGSVMRNAPVPIMYHREVDVAMELAWRQSKTTHLGDEAADCARLMTFFCVHAIRDSDSKETALQRLATFPARLYATQCLARGEAEEEHSENNGQDLADRDWTWRSRNYRFSASRAEASPDYAGSYVMDAVAMALHCVYVTDTFDAAVLYAANTCGDADTVASVTGQLAGALYGVKSIPSSWRSAVQRWDRGGDISYRAYRLYHCKGGPGFQ